MTKPSSDPKLFRVDMEPVGRRVEIGAETTLLGAAQMVGVGVVSLCGGEGWCESCRVQLVSGELSPPTPDEDNALTSNDIAAGYRLACQSFPRSHVKINIPPESLTAPQRLQVEGHAVSVELAPLITPVDITLPPPTLRDLRSDMTRLKDALIEENYEPVTCAMPVLEHLSDRLRAYDWTVRLALTQETQQAGHHIAAMLPAASSLFGLAVDIGTTKLAAYLLDLVTGETVAQTGAMNPQIMHGEDVISRIAYTDHHADGRHTLQRKLVETLNGMIRTLCEQASTLSEYIVMAVVVGNTAMHHLFTGLPVRQLAQAPYVPAVSQALRIRADEIGLQLAPGAVICLPPNIAGYVGADHVSMILATDIWQTDRTAVAVDIGTNTEITLASGGRLLSCSCASGPVFEGAHIRDGMRAAPGAVERVRIMEGKILTYTIANSPPVGICGSGILDAVAEMRAAGIVNTKGAIQRTHAHVRAGDNEHLEFLLVPAAETGHGRDVVVTHRDVNEIQLAKAAIRAGFDIVLDKAGTDIDDIDDFIIAGAFGTYIDIPNAIRVGMFPPLPLAKFRQIGNAAGMGAKRMLLSVDQLNTANAIARRVDYIELTTCPAFQTHFLNAMFL
jgi:uncharacterized 2Fe-2S/4Fe-4S cluster protein (DUF4445 family)